MLRDKILVVDDEPLQRWAVKERLSSWGYRVAEAGDLQSALDAFSRELPDLVLLDLRLGDSSGIDVLRQIKAIDPTAAIIMITAHGALDDAVSAFRLGLFDFLSKPVDFDALRTTVKYGLEAHRLRGELRRWREQDRLEHADSIVGDCGALQTIKRAMSRIATSRATTILLQGESGTGKDLFAKAIHYESARAQGPFVAVNCAALPDTLLESELFGHEKGAFTDARAVKKGLFEIADGGTLYLDEIGELKVGLQAKLLRVLETLTFRRVGSTSDINVDVRLIAASNRPLDQAIAAGEFRADLFYRLSVIQLRLPPLRERRGDIPLLVEHFVRELSQKLRKPVAQVTPEAMRALAAYDWPGNVRELKNAIERAVILEEGEEITTAFLNLPADAAEPAALTTTVGGDAVITLPSDGISLEEVEGLLVRQAMERAGGNQSRAARLLDIGRDALRYKLKKFGVISPDDSQAETGGV